MPFNKGRQPYEQIAFQFSHHIYHSDGTIEHASEYINVTAGNFPNFTFAEALKISLEKDNGTIFRFASHENSILNSIKDQLEKSKYVNKIELINFIKSITMPRRNESNAWKPKRPMVDLRDVILDFYYNPISKGSNSIKALLPSILNSCKYYKKFKPISEIKLTSLNFDDQHSWIQFENQKVVDPYTLLPTIFHGRSEEQLNKYISD